MGEWNYRRLFFAKVQNQLHWAIHGETAAEVIYHRADSEKQHMGLQTWKDAPNGKIQRFDVTVAKNYLTEQELSSMARIVNAYLDLAEMRAEEHIPMTMEDWAEQFEGILRLSKKEILTHAGSISAQIAEEHALSEFEKYRVKQDRLYQSDFDRVLLCGCVRSPFVILLGYRCKSLHGDRQDACGSYVVGEDREELRR